MAEEETQQQVEDDKYLSDDIFDEDVPLEVVMKDLEESLYNDYNQMVYLGKIEDTYEIFGHRFKARTLTSDEELKYITYLGNFMAKGDSISYMKALWIECLAYSLEEVDGEPIAVKPLKQNADEEWIKTKRKEIGSWSPFVVGEIYENVYIDLKRREKAVVDSVKKSHRVGRNASDSNNSTEDMGLMQTTILPE